MFPQKNFGNSWPSYGPQYDSYDAYNEWIYVHHQQHQQQQQQQHHQQQQQQQQQQHQHHHHHHHQQQQLPQQQQQQQQQHMNQQTHSNSVGTTVNGSVGSNNNNNNNNISTLNHSNNTSSNENNLQNNTNQYNPNLSNGINGIINTTITPPITSAGSNMSSSPEVLSNGGGSINCDNTSPNITSRTIQAKSPFGWMHKSSYQPNPGKTRTKDKYRVVYTDHQRLELEKEFHTSNYITIRRKSELAQALNLSDRQVKIWFQNRRAKGRKQQKKGNDININNHHHHQLLDVKPKLETVLPHHMQPGLQHYNLPLSMHHPLSVLHHPHHPYGLPTAAPPPLPPPVITQPPHMHQ